MAHAALDLLDGAAIGSGGGSPRHEVDVRANYTKGGLGASLNANWQAATRVETVRANLGDYYERQAAMRAADAGHAGLAALAVTYEHAHVTVEVDSPPTMRHNA